MARSPRRLELTLTEDGAESETPDFTPMPRPAAHIPRLESGTPSPLARKSPPHDLDEETEKARALSHLNLECPVCLQTCIHPVRLPCNHVFCFLCIKGVANHSKKCALCRNDIPVDYLNNPVLLDSDQLVSDSTRHHQGYQWYYEGRNGWWQYDERASRELEDKFSKGTKIFELLLAGFLYIIDFENMYQLRRNDPSRRRRIKRDLVTIEKKGVAGLKVTTPSVREGAYGAEGEKRPTTGLVPSATAVCDDGEDVVDSDIKEKDSSDDLRSDTNVENDVNADDDDDDDIEERLQRLDISARSSDGAE